MYLSTEELTQPASPPVKVFSSSGVASSAPWATATNARIDENARRTSIEEELLCF